MNKSYVKKLLLTLSLVLLFPAAQGFAEHSNRRLLTDLTGTYTRDDSRTSKSDASQCPALLSISLRQGPVLTLTDAQTQNRYYSFAQIDLGEEITEIPGGILGGGNLTVKRETSTSRNAVTHQKSSGSYLFGIPVSFRDKATYSLTLLNSTEIQFAKHGTDFDLEETESSQFECTFVRN